MHENSCCVELYLLPRRESHRFEAGLVLKMKQNKGESIDFYIKRFNKALVNTKLADSIEDAEQQKMSIFTNGLFTSLRMELQKNLNHHTSLLSVMGQARRLESLEGMTTEMEIADFESSSDE